MTTLDLRFPHEVRTVLAELARMLADAAPAALLAHTRPPEDEEPEFAEQWLTGLHRRIDEDTDAARRLLNRGDFGIESVEISDEEALAALRGFAALRLALRETALGALPDEALETGTVDRRRLKAAQRHAYACYAALGEIQAALCDVISPE